MCERRGPIRHLALTWAGLCRPIFDLIDADSQGFITAKDVRRATLCGIILFDEDLTGLEVHFEDGGIEPEDEEEIVGAIMCLDADGDAAISFEEFCAPFVDKMRGEIVASADEQLRLDFAKDPVAVEEDLALQLHELRKRTEEDCRVVLQGIWGRLAQVVTHKQALNPKP